MKTKILKFLMIFYGIGLNLQCMQEQEDPKITKARSDLKSLNTVLAKNNGDGSVAPIAHVIADYTKDISQNQAKKLIEENINPIYLPYAEFEANRKVTLSTDLLKEEYLDFKNKVKTEIETDLAKEVSNHQHYIYSNQPQPVSQPQYANVPPQQIIQNPKGTKYNTKQMCLSAAGGAITMGILIGLIIYTRQKYKEYQKNKHKSDLQNQ